MPRHCRINACFGTESYDLTPLAKKKKVLVIGGGPAGMQAARVAAWRGHDVSLWEKGKYLGGSMSLAAMVKGFKIEDVREVIWFLRRQVKKYGVDVQLGKEIDAAAIEAAKPDVVIIAAGGKPQLPDVPGVIRQERGQEQRPLRHSAVLPAPLRAQDAARAHQACGCRWARTWSSSAAPSRAASWASSSPSAAAR